MPKPRLPRWTQASSLDPGFLAGPSSLDHTHDSGRSLRVQDDSVQDILLSEQRIVPVRAAGAMIFKASEGEDPTEAVALGFERCGAGMRDLLVARAQHGVVPGDDQLLTLTARPCDAEMRQLLSNSPDVLTQGLLTAFCKGLPALARASTKDASVKEAPTERLLRRLRSALGKA